jgi:hypothetical protein
MFKIENKFSGAPQLFENCSEGTPQSAEFTAKGSQEIAGKQLNRI